ncbi:MAG TPA: acetate--CoA ligase family protein [Pseudonocardiaceae bacterium]
MATPTSAALDLTPLLAPRSIAIVGASDSGDKPGTRLARLFGDFAGPVYAVNPRKLDLPGLIWVPDVASIPEPVDLGCFALPAEGVPPALERLAEQGTRAAIVYSGGFGESGAAGAELERRLAAIVDEYGIALCGPNTAGVISLRTGFVGSFTHALVDGAPPAGSLMVVTQSGAVGGILLTRLRDRGVGVSHWISVGNGATLDVADYLDFAAADDDTAAVALFLEGLRDGAAFRAAVRRCREAGKTVIAYKAGATGEGARAALSHTGKLAGSDRVYDGVLRQLGVRRAVDLEHLAQLAMMACWSPAGVGDRGAVLSASGAGCTISVDEIVGAGLRLAGLSPATSDRLAELLPSFGQQANPIDLTGKALENLSVLRGALDAVQRDPGVDFVVLGFATKNEPEIAEAVAATWNRRKPLVCVLPVSEAAARPMREPLARHGVPAFTEYADAVRGVTGVLPARAVHPAEPAVPVAAAPGWVSGEDALSMLGAAGITVPVTERVRTEAEAEAVAARLGGGPVVVKVDHPAILHKSDFGAVRVGVVVADVAACCAELRAAASAVLPDFAEAGGFLVQQRISGGVEVLAGLSQDPTFGPVLTIGLGGTLVELLGETASRVLPLSADEMRAAISDTRLGAALVGHRGGARDVDALVRTVLRFQEFLAGRPDVVEADLNPILVLAEGCAVVDARLRLA